MKSFWIVTSVVVLIGLIYYALLETGYTPSKARRASATLKTFVTAQREYRDNDLDGNGKKDFWRGDIAGLFTLKGKDHQMIKLIELSSAAADARPVTDIEAYAPRAPKGGYWYQALRFRDEKEPGPDRYAAVAYPDRLSEGSRMMFLISHENVIYRKEILSLPIAPPDVYPEDPAKDGWEKLD